MAQDLIRYDLLAQEALRGVIRKVLQDIAQNGLPGEHHLYIAFDTTAPGVRISNRLRERYPDEMTVVLQFQFWDLEVTETGFTVALSFNNVPERLVVPFSSVKGFFDPSVQFGLQFEPMSAPAEADAGETPQGDAAPEDAESSEQGGEAAEDKPATGQDNDVGGTADVVSLDQFRKKS